MRIKVVKKGGKYKRKFSLDCVDYLTIIVVAIVFIVALIEVIIW